MDANPLRRLGLAFACLGAAAGLGHATTFLTLQSTYLGDGWFQYQMDVMKDPFFSEADIVGLNLNFTNQIDQVAGANGWSYQNDNGWAFTNGYPARPYSETFLVRSADTAFRLTQATNLLDGAMMLLSVQLAGVFPGSATGVYSQNIVGYAAMPCLVPCRPEEANDAPTNFVYTLKILPDVTIDEIIQTNAGIYGVDFAWNSPATFLLQGSFDLNTWSNITYLWSDPPQTTWTTNTPLNPLGRFFRIELVSDGHQSNLPPLQGNEVAGNGPGKKIPGPVIPRLTGCQPMAGKIAINVVLPAGMTASVQALNQWGTLLQSQPAVGNNNPQTIYFDSATLPNPVFFQVRIL